MGNIMNASAEEIMQYIREEDVKFIRLAFCDVYGRQKNISIMPTELQRAFSQGIAIDASAIEGFGGEGYSDLFLRPDPSTIAVLPWRPEHGRVVRMFCGITHADGSGLEADSRALLQRAIAEASAAGMSFSFGSQMEFYLLETDECGRPTARPFDQAGYMDIAPEDKGENVRREICLTLEQMGIFPESSHHEEGPGQNEIDFRHSDALTAADHTVTFRSVVRTIVARNGLYADFSPKPFPDQPGNGFHVHLSVHASDGTDVLPFVIGGILEQIPCMTAFFNPEAASYDRLGKHKAPKYITWSSENRSQLLRIPVSVSGERRAELRSPDPSANPYLVFALLIYAGLYGIRHCLSLPEPTTLCLHDAPAEVLAKYRRLPESLSEAQRLVKESAFIREHLPEMITRAYCERE